ncbi:hypothetical protein E2I00_007104, partial [Balaenoptera physalus]
CSSSSAWWLDCCSEQWRLCAYLKGLEEGPPEAEAHPQRAGPTPPSTVLAQRTRDFPVMEVGFSWQGAPVQSGSSFQRTTTAVPFALEHSQTVHHGGAGQSVGKATQSSIVPGRSWARLRALLQSADKMVTLLELVNGLAVSPRVKPTDTPFLDFILLYFVPFSLLLNQFCSNRDKGWNCVFRWNFMEHIEVSGNLYGTSKAAVPAVQAGVRNIGKTDLRPTCIFLRSPSLDRLEQRNTDTEQSLAAARADLKPGEQQGAWPAGQGLLGPEGGALRRNEEGSRNWPLLRRSASCVPPGAWGLAPLRARVALLTSASALGCGCCPAPSLPRRGC